MAKRIYTTDVGAQTSVSVADSLTGAGNVSVGPTIMSPVPYAASSTVTRSRLWISYAYFAHAKSAGIPNDAQVSLRIRYSTNAGVAWSNVINIVEFAEFGDETTSGPIQDTASILLPASFDLSNLRVEYFFDLTNSGTGSPVSDGYLTINNFYVIKPYHSLGIAV